VCAAVPRIASRIRWRIVRHATERNDPGNTGRLVAMALGCDLVDHGAGPDDLSARDLVFSDDAWLLFPDGTCPPAAPAEIVVVDGTWAQARRMSQKLAPLARLPRLTLPAPPPRARMREPGRPDGMSTLEAVASAIARFEGEALAAPLFALHDLIVENTRAGR
jgi:DTW domain-containing protein YfiP